MAARPLSRWERRLLIVGVVLLVLVVGFLLVHFAFMPHHDDAACGTCVVELVIELAAIAFLLTEAISYVAPGVRPRTHRQPAAAIASSRPPPSRGVVLRL